jgi:hypothetical protein
MLLWASDQFGHGFFRLFRFGQHRAQIVGRFQIVRIDLQRPAVIGNRAFLVQQVALDAAEVVQCLRQPGVEFKRLFLARGGALVILVVVIGDAEVAVRDRMVGIEPDGFFAVPDGFVQPLEDAAHLAAVGMELRVRRQNPDGLVDHLHRQLGASRTVGDDAHQVRHEGVVRLSLQYLAQQCFCALQLPRVDLLSGQYDGLFD